MVALQKSAGKTIRGYLDLLGFLFDPFDGFTAPARHFTVSSYVTIGITSADDENVDAVSC